MLNGHHLEDTESANDQLQRNEEFHRLTIQTLNDVKANRKITPDQLSLLCWHSGVRVEELE